MRDKYHISMLVPGMPFDGDTLEEKSLGGSETAGLSLSKEFSRMGHHVCMFANCDKPGFYDDVIYRPISDYESFILTTPHDVTIVQRTFEPFKAKNSAKLNIMWCHDLAIGRNAEQTRATMWNIDKIAVLSRFMYKQYKETYGLPEDVLFLTRNGIDLNRFPISDNKRRNKKRLVFSARPERGLDILIDKILPKLLEADPEIELALFGYDNPVEHMKAFYQKLAQDTAKFGSSVKFVGNLTKDRLYREYAQSGIYVYPTPSPRAPKFAEISCISAMEAQASGMPIVSSHYGALPETIAKSAGTLIKGDPMSDEYVNKFVQAVLKYVNNEDAYNSASKAGKQHAKNLDWSGVAEQWTEQIDKMFDEYNDDSVRLAHHFYRRSDIFAAKKALKGQRSSSAKNLRRRIDEEYAFISSSKALKEHYIDGGKLTTERLEKIADISALDLNDSEEPRFRVIAEILENTPDIKTILEVGCGHGWSTVYLHNKVGRLWTGLDIDPGAISWANKMSQAHANDPKMIEFIEGDHNYQFTKGRLFDCLILSDVLEHCIDPVSVVQKLERWVRPGGAVIITVPHGPAEFGTANWIYFRNHIWELEPHDLDDMFGKKKLSIQCSTNIVNQYTDEPVGFYTIQYEADHKPLGKIDMVRKLRLQRPRSTISACIIGGPGIEDTLRWSLTPLAQVVDEIVIADTGMNEEAMKICNDFGVRRIPGSNPVVEGFETPRNEVLAECSMDFILWVDTDERLLNGHWLMKYARRNMFDGYSIRQHHFAVDTTFEPDMPVRMFRRVHKDGVQPRFFGMVHEHPERGLNEGPGQILVIGEVHIAHLGYLVEQGRKVRFSRNRPLVKRDQEKYPDRILQKHFEMRDLMLENSYLIQRDGGVTEQNREEIEIRARSVVEIYREQFMGKSKLSGNVDSLQYYSQALMQLDEGIDVSYSFSVSRNGFGDQHDGSDRSARFANVDEAKQEIGIILDGKFGRVDKKYW